MTRRSSGSFSGESRTTRRIPRGFCVDFFTSDNTLYRDEVRRALDSIAQAGLETETSVDSRDFVRIFVDKRLKVDFVNDRVYRHGMPALSSEGYRLDNLANIFANKLCALIGRDEPKDVFDICLLSQLDEAPSIGLLAIARRLLDSLATIGDP